MKVDDIGTVEMCVPDKGTEFKYSHGKMGRTPIPVRVRIVEMGDNGMIFIIPVDPVDYPPLAKGNRIETEGSNFTPE